MMERNQPVQDYATLKGLQSNMSAQAYLDQQQNVSQGTAAAAAASLQAAQLAQQQRQFNAQNDPNNYGGTGMSYEQVLAAQNAAAANFADSNKPKGPSYGAQIAGGILNGIGNGLFK